MELLSSFGALFSKNTIPGQAPIGYSNQNFRISSQSFEASSRGGYGLEVPRTDLESALGYSMSKIEVLPGVADGSSSSAVGAVHLQVIEVKSKLMTFAADPLMTGAGKAIAGPKSNALSITSKGVSEMFVKLQHHTSEAGSTYRFRLTTRCISADDYHEESYICPDSGHVIHNSCPGKIGNITTECPVYAHGCAMLNMTSGVSSGLNSSHSACKIWNYTADYTYCRCMIPSTSSNLANSTSSSRRLDASQPLEQSNTMTLVSMSSFLASDVDQSFSAAPALTDAKAIERVLTVIIMFSALWAGGMALIFGCIWRSHRQKPVHEQNKEKLKRKSMMSEHIRSPIAIYEKISEYVHAVFPAVYNHTSPLIRLKDELRKNHRYLKLFTAPANEMGDQSRILTGMQLLTTQSMLMFFLALFYDLQGPDDDGSCVKFVTEENCLSRKSMLDSAQMYCHWGYAEAKGSYVCTFNNEGISFLAAIYAAVIVSIVSSLFMKPMDYFFDILTAPTADVLKAKLQGGNGVGAAMEQKMVAVAQGVRRVARRMSAMASTAVQQSMPTRRSVYNVTDIKAGVLTRHIPEEVNEAHELARSSMVLIANTAQEELQRYALRQTVLMKRLSVGSDDLAGSDEDSDSHSDSSESADDDNEAEEDEESSEGVHTPRKEVLVRDVDAVSVSVSNGRRKEGLIVEQSIQKQRAKLPSVSFGRPILEDLNGAFAKLEEEIHTQRRLLQKEEVENYDMQWGLDPSGEFVHERRRSLLRLSGSIPGMKQCCGMGEGAITNIKREMMVAQKESAKKIEKLSIATDTHIGMEILHTFILDMLGRDTAAATIFRSNTEEEFRHAEVVTRRAKYGAGVMILVLNVFFAYYSVLKGFVKRVTWQYEYLIACIVQMLVEILLFETLECLWMNFFVPNMVAHEVQEVHTMLIETVDRLCRQAGNRGGQSGDIGEEEEESRYFLNAPEYLFVSTNIAKAYPELMESMIVLSYHNHLPGELSKKWHLGSNLRIHQEQMQRQRGRRGGSSNLRNVAIVGIGMGILQSLASSPFFLQRMMIRFVQPFVLGGLMLMWVDMMNNTWAMGVFCVLVSLLVAGLIYRYYYDHHHQMKQTKRAVTPENSVIVACDHVETIPFVEIPQIYDKHKIREIEDEAKEWSESHDQSSSEDEISASEDDVHVNMPSTGFMKRLPSINARSVQSLQSADRYSVSEVSAYSFGDISSLSESTSGGGDKISSLTSCEVGGRLCHVTIC
jgi:hypothetical protein